MNKIFRRGEWFPIPDGTLVSPFLNPTDVQQTDVPWDGVSDQSIAAGRVRAESTSKIHLLPVVAQVTLVTVGRLTVRMMEPDDAAPYSLDLGVGDAVLTPTGRVLAALQRLQRRRGRPLHREPHLRPTTTACTTTPS